MKSEIPSEKEIIEFLDMNINGVRLAKKVVASTLVFNGNLKILLVGNNETGKTMLLKTLANNYNNLIYCNLSQGPIPESEGILLLDEISERTILPDKKIIATIVQRCKKFSDIYQAHSYEFLSQFDAIIPMFKEKND